MKNEYKVGTKKCTRCKKNVDVNRFYKKISSSDGLSYHCFDCEKIMKKERRIKMMEGIIIAF
jgi:DNA-directed RNA polymerase subunit RPC12/RpoP